MAGDPGGAPADRAPVIPRIVRLLRPYRAQLALVGVAVVVSAGLTSIVPFLTRAVFDDALFPVGGTTQTVPISSRVTFDTIDAVVEAGLAGLGLIRVFCYHARPAIRAGHMREVLAPFAPPGLPVHVVHGGNDRVPLKVRAFIDFAAPRLHDSLQR